MNNGTLIKIKAATAADVCAHFELNKEARTLLREGQVPREFVEALLANRQYITGIDFVGHALPAREAVWWGCLCLQHTCGSNLSISDQAACQAAVRWVLEPTEENRLAAKEHSEKAGQGSVAEALAGASHLTEDPSCPPDPSRKPSFGPAKAVAGAIKLASTKADPSRIVETHRLFLELGIGVAEGRFRWPEVHQKAPLKNGSRKTEG
jgi:hypothetical protein